MVVEARRLRQLYGHDVAGLHADVRQLATASPDPAMAQWLAARWSDRYEAAVRDELAALLAGDSAELAVTRAAVAGALQAEVLRHEMTRVYQAIAADSAAGSDVARSHVFRRQFEAAVAEPFASPSTVRSASGLVDGAFAAYAVGAETVGDELTSDRGVKTALHAAVVAVGAVGSEERLRNVTPPARGALLWAHRLYRYFTTNSPLGRLARFVVFAIAGGLISVAFISGDANPLLSVFGLAALLIAVLLGITPEPRLLLAMVGLVAVAVLVWHAGSLADLRSWGVAIVLGGVVLLLAAVWWRGLLPAVMSLALMAVLVVGSLAAVRYIDPVQEWVVGGEASAPQEPPADPEIEELVAALEARLGPGTVTIDRGTGLDGFLGWVEEHRIEIVALLLIVGFGFLGAYRSRVL
jgi:hypothetical protein